MSAGLRCGSTTIKYLLFFFNFLFVLSGIALIAIGAISLNSQTVAGTGYNSALILIIAVGAIIFLVSFYGCCGAIRESHCMLITFAVFLMSIIVIEVVAVVLVFVNSGDLSVKNSIEEVFDKALKHNDQQSIQATNAVQTAFSCCGLSGPSYWPKENFPQSCCKIQEAETCTSNIAYQDGCENKIADFMKKYSKISGAVAIAIAVIEVIGVWFALGLAGSIRSLERGGRR